MRKVFSIILFVLALSSCQFESQSPTNIKEEYNPTDEELFASCAELQGVGQFIIGKTTFKAVLNDSDYNKNVSQYLRRSNLYNGHWGIEFWRSNSIADMDKARWIENNSKGKIKQLTVSFPDMTIGDLSFDKFDMAFLNDTLVAIFYFPDREFEEDVITHYKQKYGNGSGHYHHYDDITVKKDGYIVGQARTDEHHTWANEEVAIDYDYFESYKYVEGHIDVGTFFSEKTLIIYSKNRYPVFEEILLSLSKQYDEEKQQQKSNTLKSL